MGATLRYEIEEDDRVSVRHVSEFGLTPVAAGSGAETQVLIGPDQGPNFALRRFVMQPGGGMPRHTNTVEHEQYVLRGQARVSIGDERHDVKAGDVVYIPAGTPHSYDAVGDEPFEFLCAVPNRPDKIELVDC